MAKKKSDQEESLTLWSLQIAGAIFFGVLFLFLATNILFAVSLPDIDPMVSGKNDALVIFMKRARKITSFQRLYPEIKSMFIDHEGDLYKEDRDRLTMISKLEKALTINPKSRDILYSLYLLYDKSGNTEKAVYYLHQAQEVDPEIK